MGESLLTRLVALVLLAPLFTMAAPSAAAASPGTWAPIPPTGTFPTPVLTAVWTGSEAILWGVEGSNTGGVAYNPTIGTWHDLPAAGSPPVPPGNTVTSAWTGSDLLILEDCQNHGYRYQRAADSWSMTSIGAFTPRQAALSIWTGQDLMIHGGETCSQFPVPLFDGARYDPATDTWATIPAEPNLILNPPGQSALAWTGSRLIVFGVIEGGGVFYWGGASYDPIANTWAPVAPAPLSPGSTVESALGSVHAAAWTGRTLIIYGSFPLCACTTFNDVGGQYDPATDSWQLLPTTNAPSQRNGESVVWTGSQLVIWGGASNAGGGPLTDGARYDLATNTWQPLPSAGAPGPRFLPAAVWTGSDLIIFGGLPTSPRQVVSPGSRYDPGVDQWTPLPTSGAPPNNGVTLAANGSLLVFGGQTGGASFTPPAIGGENFTLLAEPAGAVGLEWSGALGESGYVLLRRAANGTITTVPSSGLLPPTTTGYLDTPPASDGVDCYVLVAVGSGGVLGNSDVLCLLPDTRSASGPPPLFAIQLDQTPTTTLAWTAPTGATSYELAALPQIAGATPRISGLPATPMMAQDQTGDVVTCYLLLPLAGLQVLGNSDILCDVPGAASPSLSPQGTVAPPASVRTAPTPSLATAKQHLTNAAEQVSADWTKATFRRVVSHRASYDKARPGP